MGVAAIDTDRLQNPAEGHTGTRPWPRQGGCPCGDPHGPLIPPRQSLPKEVWFCLVGVGCPGSPEGPAFCFQMGGLTVPHPQPVAVSSPEAVDAFRHGGSKGHIQRKSQKRKPGSQPTGDQSTAPGVLGICRT